MACVSCSVGQVNQNVPHRYHSNGTYATLSPPLAPTKNLTDNTEHNARSRSSVAGVALVQQQMDRFCVKWVLSSIIDKWIFVGARSM